MICPNCKFDRLITDFINNQKFCYHCIYRQKLSKGMKNRTEKIPVCRMCGNEIMETTDKKKRKRTVFCSSECGEKGHKQQLHDHWTRKIRSIKP